MHVDERGDDLAHGPPIEEWEGTEEEKEVRLRETLQGVKTDGGSVGLFKISHIGGHRYAVRGRAPEPRARELPREQSGLTSPGRTLPTGQCHPVLPERYLRLVRSSHAGRRRCHRKPVVARPLRAILLTDDSFRSQVDRTIMQGKIIPELLRGGLGLSGKNGPKGVLDW